MDILQKMMQWNAYLSFRREQFIENELPVFMRNIFLLKMDFKEIKTLYDQFVKDNFKK